MPGAEEEQEMEFLIRCVDDQWFNINYAKIAQILKPINIRSRPVDGWGTHRIEVEGVEISFSDEGPGFQVCFETRIDLSKAQKIVHEIAENITKVTGQRARVVLITPGYQSMGDSRPSKTKDLAEVRPPTRGAGGR